MQKTWLDPIHENCYKLTDCANDLLSLADSFHDVGNSKVANRLAHIADRVRESQETIYKAVGAHVHDEFQRSQESTANMLSALLAGVDIARESLKK